MRKISKCEPLSVMRIGAIRHGAMERLEGAMFSLMFALIPMADSRSGQQTYSAADKPTRGEYIYAPVQEGAELQWLMR